MNHLDEMCCDACREKLEQIIGRRGTTALASDDRDDLLLMVEHLLLTVAKQRASLTRASELLQAADTTLAHMIELAEQMATLEQLRNERERCFQILESVGVSRTRAKTADNGIAVLVARDAKAGNAMTHEMLLLREALRWVLESGVIKCVTYVGGERVVRLVDGSDYEAVVIPEHLREVIEAACK